MGRAFAVELWSFYESIVIAEKLIVFVRFVKMSQNCDTAFVIALSNEFVMFNVKRTRISINVYLKENL